mgnify:CR=1 FL=1
MNDDIVINFEENPTDKHSYSPSNPIRTNVPVLFQINIHGGDLGEEQDSQHLIRIMQPNIQNEKTRENNINFDCAICFQSLHIVHLMPLVCGHQFCRSCFEKYIKQLISEKRVYNSICHQY